MHDKGDLDRILEDINNCAVNQKKDKFTLKFCFVTCNEFYSDKAGLPNLPQTKDDFSSIKRTVNMMDIKRENMYELIDTNHDEIQETYNKMSDRILAVAPKLGPLTGIGSSRKFT